MDNIIDAMMGLDKRKEIFNLWYELIYQRYLLNVLMFKCGEQSIIIDSDLIKAAREHAQEYVKKKFPECGLTFKDPLEDEVKNEAAVN